MKIKCSSLKIYSVNLLHIHFLSRAANSLQYMYNNAQPHKYLAKRLRNFVVDRDLLKFLLHVISRRSTAFNQNFLNQTSIFDNLSI